MIRQFTGLPGAGKSYASLGDIYTEMTRGYRTVYHNMVIDHGELAFYSKEKGYEPDFAQRIRKLPEDKIRKFWEYAREDGVLGGRLFVIDEAHIYFDARSWAEIGRDMSTYLTQHRHLNDEILFVTQHPEMLDKRIRLLVAQTTTFRNLRTERWLQMFKPPAWMIWSEYFGLPKHGQKPDAVGKRKIDPAFAKCYQTSVGHAGLGATGRTEQDRPTRKLKWYWLAVPAVGLLALAAYGPELLVRLTVGRGMAAFGAEQKTKVQPGIVPPANVVLPTKAMPQGSAQGPATKEPNPAPIPVVTGVLRSNTKMAIILNDGRVITDEDQPYRKGGYVYWGDGSEKALLKR